MINQTPMPANAESMATAEAEKHTNCARCQAEMIDWRLANPNATKLNAETAHAEIWQECPSCQSEYAEWCDEANRQAEREANSLETAEHEAYEADLERQAEEAELARDAIWQQGRQV